jgi:indole-3-glycerol phosphate synthase
VLPDRDINYMLKICKKLGMAALVEVSELFLQYVLYAEAFQLFSPASLE